MEEKETPSRSIAAAPSAPKKGRLEWLDALRGFTMLLVVAYHVGQHCYGMNLKTSMSMPFFVLFRMPLFFFVSGFLAYKAGMQWTGRRLGMMVWKKVKIQTLPTVVFMVAYLALCKPHFWKALDIALASPTKSGYWFTWVLLLMFILYYVADALAALCRGRGHWHVWVLWVLALAVYETAYLPKVFHYQKSPFMCYTSLIEVVYYFHFFLMGNLVHRYWAGFQRLFDSRWFFPLLVLLAFVCCGDALRWHHLRMEWANLPRTVAMYALMFIVVMTFRHYDSALSQRTWVGRTLQFIGMRTLDIYLLHYFLLPKLPMVGKWLDAQKSGDFLTEQVLTLGGAVIVVAGCCLISSVLRTSPLLKKYLFGRKASPPNPLPEREGGDWPQTY